MLDVLNALFLAGTVASQAINIVGLAEADIDIRPSQRVYAVAMRQQAPMWVDKCAYDGVMVEYARDWEEVQEHTGIVSPPEPDKPVGYALILTKERCPGKPEVKIFSTGAKYLYPLLGKGYVIREGHRMDAVAYPGARPDSGPKWMPQVLKTIETEALTNPAAKLFMADIQGRASTAH